jgi:hypothetical protein
MSELIKEFLNDEEAKMLCSMLSSKGFEAFTIDASGDGSGMENHKVFVSQIDQEVFKVLKQFNSYLRIKIEDDKMKCSTCKSIPPDTYFLTDISFIRKIFTKGIKIVKCGNCNREWYI